MKTRITFVLAVLLTSISFAQQGINYKALIKDGGGNIVASQSITIQFQILQGGGMINVYQETHTPSTDANGIIIINIGEGAVDSGVFADIDWGADNHYLNVQINTGGGLTDMGTTQFMSVPYALNAKIAESVTSACDLAIGDSHEGGIIYYLDASGCHGLTAKATDEPGTYQWSTDSDNYFNTFAFANGIFTGAYNTTKANSYVDPAPAANVCEVLADGGYDDWYLPSIYELNLMHLHIGLGNLLGLGNIGGFQAEAYWSSTERDISTVYNSHFFFNDWRGWDDKDNSFLVRAIRAF